MRFQYLKHSLQKRMVYHSNQLREAIIKLWQRGYSYSSIVDTINGSAIAQISKGTVAYQVKKFQETNSVVTMKKTGRPRSVRTPNLRRSTKAKIVRNQKRSQRKLAREAGISLTSMNRMVRKDLNMTSYKIKQRQLLDEGKKEKKIVSRPLAPKMVPNCL